jgi:hypothetical protein
MEREHMSNSDHGVSSSPPSESSGQPAAIQAVLRRFPSHREPIEKLYEENDSFRELCGDYRDAVDALRRLESPGRGQDMQLQEEYRALCLHLECELLRYLETHPPR